MTEPRDVTYLVPADVLAEVNVAVTVLETYGPAVTEALRQLDRATTVAWNADCHPFPGSGTLTRSWSRRPPAAGQHARPEPALAACGAMEPHRRSYGDCRKASRGSHRPGRVGAGVAAAPATVAALPPRP